MANIRMFLLALLFAAAFINPALAATGAAELERDSRQALEKIYKINPLAERLSHKAKAILVFPKIVKAGLMVGGSYGEGVLMKESKAEGYFNSASASFGLQIGAQSYGYVMFLMTDKVLASLHETHGWEIGVGPTVVIVDEGVAKNLSSTTLKDDAYAFIFGQQGLMAGISLEGSKISKIKRY